MNDENRGVPTQRDFGEGTAIASVHETAIAARVADARARVEARYIMAYQRPRDMDEVRVRLLKDCKRARFAEVALYAKPVGGRKAIEGFSIRFAEAAARAYGNVEIAAPILYEDDEKRIIKVGATDLENNVAWDVEVSIPKIVERRKLKDGQEAIGMRTTSSGGQNYLVKASDDEMLNKHGSQVSKAARNQILRLIPGDILDEAEQAIRKTLRTDDAVDPEGARKRLIDAFDHQGVSVAEIKKLLGHDIASCSQAEMSFLRKTYAAIRDGETTWADVLREYQDEPTGADGKPKSRSDKVKDAVAARAKEAKAEEDKKKREAEEAGKAKKNSETEKTDEEKSEAPEEPKPDHDPESGEVSEEDEPSDDDLGIEKDD